MSGADGVVASVTTNYDPNTGLSITQANATNYSGANTVTNLVLKDHLSSMVADYTLTGNTASPTTGTLTVHGFGPWGNARNTSNPLAEGSRGFTGHEHLAEIGLIHMNGRIYDPHLGRFLQADPVIQAPGNAQNHNRYSYVLNNPLSYSDPSGFSWWTKWRSSIVSAIAWAVTFIVTNGCERCATFVANAIKAGMDAHQSGTNIGRAIAASVVATFVGDKLSGGWENFRGGITGGIQAALNGANRREILGAVAGGLVGDAFGSSDNAGIRALGIPVSGCADYGVRSCNIALSYHLAFTARLTVA